MVLSQIGGANCDKKDFEQQTIQNKSDQEISSEIVWGLVPIPKRRRGNILFLFDPKGNRHNFSQYSILVRKQVLLILILMPN